MNLKTLSEELLSPKIEIAKEASDTLLSFPIKKIQQWLNDSIHRNDVQAFFANLAQTNQSEIISLLIELTKSDAFYRPFALSALVEHSSAQSSVEHQLIFYRLMLDDDKFIRALSVKGLAKIGDKKARQALVLALNDSDEWVKHAAQEAFDSLQSNQQKSKALILDPNPHRMDLSKLYSNHPNEQQKRIAELLKTPTESINAVEHLFSQSGYDKNATFAAMQLLQQIGGDQALDLLLNGLDIKNIPSSLRASFLHAIADITPTIKHPEVCDFQFIREHLNDRDPYIRKAAIRVLILAQSEEAASFDDETIEALFDEVPDIQAELFNHLAQHENLDSKRLSPLLLSALSYISDSQVLINVFAVIARTTAHDQDACTRFTGPLSYFLDHEDETLAQHAFELLAKTLRPEDFSREIALQFHEHLSENPHNIAFVISMFDAFTVQKENDIDISLLKKAFALSHQSEQIDKLSELLIKTGSQNALSFLIEAANRGDQKSEIAHRHLEQLDSDAAYRAEYDDGWTLKFTAFCDCGQELELIEKGSREILFCKVCEQDYILSHTQKLFRADQTPFGSCLCCKRKQVLILEDRAKGLICPLSKEIHIRPDDAPNQLIRLKHLPYGACSCCKPPQPLVRKANHIQCRKTERRYVKIEENYQLLMPSNGAHLNQIQAINEALLTGSLNLAESGVIVPAKDDDDH